MTTATSSIRFIAARRGASGTRSLIGYSIAGGITQARIAHEVSNGQGRIHMNVLWEMGAAERILHGILEGSKGLIHGVTCGAGMPYKVAEIAVSYGIHYYPIVSSARAFRALWKRAYHRFSDNLGGVVYEDPWLAGGHNGLSNSEDPESPEDPFPRVLALRQMMNSFGLQNTPIVMAGGVWYLREWEEWIDNPDLGPIAFQYGTRPLLTQESPISEAWKRKLLTLKEGDVFLNKFSPTGFYSSAVNNAFIQELRGRGERQVAYSVKPGRRARHRVPRRPPWPAGLPDGPRPRPRLRLGRGRVQGSPEDPGQHADLRDDGVIAQDPARPDRLHGLPVGLHVLQLGAERGRHDRQESRPALLLHPEDLAGDQPLRRLRNPAHVRRPQRLPLRQRPVLRERLHPDGEAARGQDRFGRLIHSSCMEKAAGAKAPAADVSRETLSRTGSQGRSTTFMHSSCLFRKVE